ncbi:MAG: HupE/UreJ family protein [Proteobacteria bacterium]|nr:HupE/UreJ family protein [Pseudomonadota bacterium]
MARRLLLALVVLFGLCASARAHDPGMTVATVIADERETLVELSIKGSDLERAAGVELLDPGGRVDPELLAGAAAAVRVHLRATAAIETDSAVCPLEVVELVAVEDGVLAVLKAPCGTAEAGLSYRSWLLQETNPATIQHVVLLKGDDAFPAALTRTRNRLEIQAPLPLTEVATRYLASGAEHLSTGYDHVAFLLALLLWARSVWAVVKVITAFTLSHSITLSLAALDLVSLPSAVVEPLIAASIVAVALENFFDRRIERRWRVAFFLGFIHGFGFAGALRDIGLPQDALLIALAFFNIGVEIGQVAIVAIVVPLLLVIDRLTTRAPAAPARRPALVYAVSALIAGLGGYWFIERTLFA